MNTSRVEHSAKMTNGKKDKQVDEIESSNGLKRPIRDDEPLWKNVFPDTDIGKLLHGISLSYLIKQEPRLGWGRKGACSEKTLMKHPCEAVAAHQWGVGWLISCLTASKAFQEEILGDDFDMSSALRMAQIHDLAELQTGDITPVDGITPEEKHRLESEAMDAIMACFPPEVAESHHKIYARYEERRCKESKLVKDCDRLDFMITAFVLERQGFMGFSEFYVNSNKDFSTRLTQDLANQLIETRDQLAKTGTLYPQ